MSAVLLYRTQPCRTLVRYATLDTLSRCELWNRIDMVMLQPLARQLSHEVAPVRMKGIGFANVQNFVLTRCDRETWLRVLSELEPADRAEIEACVAVGWYSTYLFARLLCAVDRVCGTGDLRLLPSIGRFEAEADISRTLRYLIRVLHPSSIFKAERRLWGHFHDSGQWTFSSVETGVDGTLDGWAEDRALCLELSGYLVRMVEFTGGRNVTVEHAECRGTGSAKCVFQFRWG